MSSDTLTVGQSRRIVQEILSNLGPERLQVIDRDLPGDEEPITIESFRRVMREGLEGLFALSAIDNTLREQATETRELSKAQAELERLCQKRGKSLLTLWTMYQRPSGSSKLWQH